MLEELPEDECAECERWECPVCHSPDDFEGNCGQPEFVKGHRAGWLAAKASS